MPFVTVVDVVISTKSVFIQKDLFQLLKERYNQEKPLKTWLQQFSVILLSCLMANEQQVLQTDCSCSHARWSRLSLFYYDYNQSQSRPVALLSRVNTYHSCFPHARPQCLCQDTARQLKGREKAAAVSSSSSLSLSTRVVG